MESYLDATIYPDSLLVDDDGAIEYFKQSVTDRMAIFVRSNNITAKGMVSSGSPGTAFMLILRKALEHPIAGIQAKPISVSARFEQRFVY